MFDRVIQDRWELLGPMLGKLEVLDVGCVDARPARRASADIARHEPNLLFKRICEANPATVGLDIDAEGVAALAELGYTVRCGDAQTADLGRPFDLIVAGEVIEHIENPGQFLRNMRRHLKPAGRLVLTTPNPFYCGQHWRIWRHGRPGIHEDHVLWLDPATAVRLLERAGLQLQEGLWIQPRRPFLKTWKRILRPYFSHSFLCVAAVAPEAK